MASASGLQGSCTVGSLRELQPREYLKEMKIVLLGDTKVGKSALTLQYVAKIFPSQHDPTLGDSYKGKVFVDDKPVVLSIMDTGGKDEFRQLQEHAVKCGEGFMICYSITDRCSFLKVEEYRQLVTKYFAADSIPIVLVGNKIDLDNPLRRQVSREEGESLAHSRGWSFIETSATNRLDVNDAFLTLLREIPKKEKGTSEACSEPHSHWRRFKSIFLKIICIQQRQEFDDERVS